MIETLRNLVVVELKNRMNASVEAVANLTYYTASQRPDGQMMPGTSLEALGVQTIAHNARSRALHEAMTVLEAAYKQLTAPAQAPKDGPAKPEEGPYR